MIDDEVDLGPVLGGLADVPHRVVLPHVGPRFLVVRREQPLVDAHGGDACLHDLLVEGVHELLIIEPPVGPELGGKERIADGVALPAVGLHDGDATIDLLDPPLALRREDGVAEKAARSGDLVDGRARGGDLVVGEEVPGGVVKGRPRQQRDLGVAVDEDLLHIVLELEAGEVVLAREGGIPVLLGVLGQVEQPLLLEVVAHEVRLVVDDELPGQRSGPGVGDARGLRLGRGHLEEGPEDLVHGQEGRGHARAAGQEAPAAQAVAPAEVVGKHLEPRLHLPLLARLGQRVELSVGHDLGRDRRPERGGLRRRRSLELRVAEIVRHGGPPCPEGGWGDGCAQRLGRGAGVSMGNDLHTIAGERNSGANYAGLLRTDSGATAVRGSCVIACVIFEPGAGSTSSSTATAARRCSGARWAYRMVMAMVRWPRASPTSFSERPRCMSQGAKVWRLCRHRHKRHHAGSRLIPGRTILGAHSALIPSSLSRCQPA